MKATCAERRFLAKRYDSYQWQKLFWIALGIMPYALIGDGLRMGELVVMLTCLIGGWRGTALLAQSQGGNRPMNTVRQAVWRGLCSGNGRPAVGKFGEVVCLPIDVDDKGMKSSTCCSWIRLLISPSMKGEAISFQVDTRDRRQ